MSDYAELVKRLRFISDGPLLEMRMAAADALEAQARRIEELDDECRQSMLTIALEREAVAMAYESGWRAGLGAAADVAESGANFVDVPYSNQSADWDRIAAAIRKLKERT